MQKIHDINLFKDSDEKMNINKEIKIAIISKKNSVNLYFSLFNLFSYVYFISKTLNMFELNIFLNLLFDVEQKLR